LEERILHWISDRLADRVASSVNFTKGADPGIFSRRVERIALNVRVPFCRARCPFCAFPGEVYTEQYKRIYINGIRDELRLYSEGFEGKGSRPMVERVYLSGGTPTLLYKEFGQVKGYVSEYFSFNGKIAIEAYPNDLNEEVLKALVESGVNHVSIGVQTFNEAVLSKSLGRKGRREELTAVLKRVMDFGFEYVNIDLMFSLPNQTKEMLVEDLETAAGMGLHGISTYPLMLLHYTTLAKIQSTGGGNRSKRETAIETDEGKETEQYLAILETLGRYGYKLRTLWSFSLKPEAYEGPYEHECFIGLGPRAWGFVNNRFTLNAPSTEDYLATINEGKLPVYAFSEVRNSPLVKLARHFYYGGVSRSYLKGLVEEGLWLRVLIGVLRLTGLVKWEGDELKLTRKALAYGSIATKKIAYTTLTKMDGILRAG
jgi:oxygen-independent coproporphyrinogen-3 oxidase